VFVKYRYHRILNWLTGLHRLVARFDPGRGKATFCEAKLPPPLHHRVAITDTYVWHGGCYFLFQPANTGRKSPSSQAS
jgi:hypothetical protein